MSTGFFVPNSRFNNYVANKKTSEGSYYYDDKQSQIGVGRQRALQYANKQYSATLEQAYNSYQSSNDMIGGSNMGTGFKEAYLEKSKNQLIFNAANANLSAAAVRQDINDRTQAAMANVQGEFTKEVMNMDRASAYAEEYLKYLGTLYNDNGESYIPEDKKKYSLDVMYNDVFNAQPVDYTDENAKQGLSYYEWVKSRLGGSASDLEWSQWAFGLGGLNQFEKSIRG